MEEGTQIVPNSAVVGSGFAAEFLPPHGLEQAVSSSVRLVLSSS